MNSLEEELVQKISNLSNLRWWHRNISRKGFCINGFIRHYPDLIFLTNNGKLIVAETKGSHLKNQDTKNKILLGKQWANKAGSNYRYFLIFENADDLPEGAVSIGKFIDIIKEI